MAIPYYICTQIHEKPINKVKMKNIAKALVVLLAAACAATAYAKPVLNETTGKEYRNLRDAVKNAQTGNVLIVNESTTLTSPIAPDNRELTIKGANDNIVITYDVKTSSGAYSSMIVYDKEANTGVLNLENLTFENTNGVELDGNYILVRNGGVLNLKNVTFKGFKTSCTNGLLRVLSNNKSEVPAQSTVTLDNVRFEGCVTTVDVFIANNKSTIRMSGDCLMSVSLNNAGGVAIDAAGLANTTPVKLFAQRRRAGKPIVKGCSDTARFNWVDADGMSLVAKGNDIVTE